jgi:hypothetical protein
MPWTDPDTTASASGSQILPLQIGLPGAFRGLHEVPPCRGPPAHVVPPPAVSDLLCRVTACGRGTPGTHGGAKRCLPDACQGSLHKWPGILVPLSVLGPVHETCGGAVASNPSNGCLFALAPSRARSGLRYPAAPRHPVIAHLAWAISEPGPICLRVGDRKRAPCTELLHLRAAYVGQEAFHTRGAGAGPCTGGNLRCKDVAPLCLRRFEQRLGGKGLPTSSWQEKMP